MPLPDNVSQRLIQTRLLLDRDRVLAMNQQVSPPLMNPLPGTHPDHADLLRVAGGFVLGVVRVDRGPRPHGADPFAGLRPGVERPPGTWYVFGDVHDVDHLALSDDGSVWLVDGEPGGHWPDGTAYRRLADSLADFLRHDVFGARYHKLTEIPGDDWAETAPRLDELQPLVEYVRFEGIEATRRMTHPGLFALADGLAHSGRLAPEDRAWWRSHTSLVEERCPDPATFHPAVYDRRRHPEARVYYRSDALQLIDLARRFLDLLDRYAVGWREIRTYDPGRVLYADDVQVVAEPWRD